MRRRLNWFRSLGLIAALTLLVAGCVAPETSPTTAPSGTGAQPAATTAPGTAATAAPATAAAGEQVAEVPVGLLYPTTGTTATLGQAMVNGHMLAIDEINAAGGIKALGGAKLKPVLADTQSKTDVGISQAQRLIDQEKVPIIMGAYQSAVTFATTQVAEQKQIPYIVPLGAADNITERGFKYTFKVSPKGSKAVEDQIKIVQDLGQQFGSPAKTVGIIYADNLFGKNQAEALKQALPSSGFELITELSYPETTTDVSGVIAKLKAANPDVVFQSSYTQDGILISRAMAAQNYSPPLGFVGFGGNAGDPQFFQAVGDQAEHYITIGYWTSTLTAPGVKEAAEAYQSRFNMEMDEYSAPAYNATYVLADALERAASIDPQKIRDAIASTNMPVGAKGNVFPFPITFGPDGQTPSYFIGTQVINGERPVIWPEEAAAGVKPVWPAVLGTQK